MTTPDRPAGLRYFETFSEHCLAALETAREAGRPIAGVYCIYAPYEIIRAAGAVPIGLCGKRQAPIQAAEEDLPPSLCPLIKSSYGYAKTDTCPFFAASDFILAETTCDGKKKMFELLGRIKPVHLMHLPYSQTMDGARAFWLTEQRRLANFLGTQGQPVTDEGLLEQIAIQNDIRALIRDIVRINADGDPILTGMDLLPVLESKSFVVDFDPYLTALRNLRDELAGLRAAGTPGMGRRLRILLTGTPVGNGSHKVLQLIEESGGVVVAMDNCSGIKGLDPLEADENDPLRSIADYYLNIPCACMSPNPGRTQTLETLCRDFRIDGIVDLTWQGCHGFNVEATQVREKANSLDVPILHIETAYSESDTEQLRTRIEAFLESIS